MIDIIDHEQRELNKSLHGGTFCLSLFPKESEYAETICRFDPGKGPSMTGIDLTII